MDLSVAGWEQLPKLLLRICLENPYVFELIKADTLNWEWSVAS